MRFVLLIAPIIAPIIAVATFFAGAAVADDPRDRKMLSAADQAAWSGVGRVNLGNAFCTGALIAPDLVVTAGHCLHVGATGAARLAQRVHFVAGYRQGKYQGHSKAARLVLHPGYRQTGRINGETISKDLALMYLESEITAVAPFALSDTLEEGELVTILSYGRDRPEIASVQTECPVEARVGDIAVLDCIVVSGVSGSPVFRKTDEGWGIAAVVSAVGQFKGGQKTFAVVLENTLGEVLAAP